MTVSGSARHVEENGSVGDSLRRADQQQPLPGVRPLNRLEVQGRPITRLRAAILQKSETSEMSDRFSSSRTCVSSP